MTGSFSRFSLGIYIHTYDISCYDHIHNEKQNNEQGREKKKKQCAVFITHASYPICLVDGSSRSMTRLCVSRYQVPQIEVEG